jgi:hypothetical protein
LEEINKVLNLKIKANLTNSDLPLGLSHIIQESSWIINFSITKEYINLHGQIPSFSKSFRFKGLAVSHWINNHFLKSAKGQLT